MNTIVSEFPDSSGEKLQMLGYLHIFLHLLGLGMAIPF
jgi:hypothetical protein